MTVEETEQIQNNSKKVDFESLLLKRESKLKFLDKDWSTAKLKNISVYNGYILYEYKKFKSDSLCSTHVITKSNDVKEIIKKHTSDSDDIYTQLIHTTLNPYTNNIITSKDGKKWIYKKYNMVIATISTVDENYEENYIINYKKYRHNIHNTNNLIKELKNKINRTGLIGEPVLSNKILQFKDKKPVNRTKTFFKNISVYIGMSSIFLINTYLLFENIHHIMSLPFILPSLVILGSIFISIGIMLMINKKHFNNWYQLKKFDDIDNLPTDAKLNIDDMKNNVDTYYDNADVSIYESGDVVVELDNITWTFKNTDNLPSEDAVKLYNTYGIDFNNENNIPIKYYKFNTQRKSRNNTYVSDCGNWIFETDTI